MAFRRGFLVLLLHQQAMGLLWLCPFVIGSYGRRFSRPWVGIAYLFVGSPRVHSTGDPGSSPRLMREVG
jgi:hypothetical protein